MKRAKYLITVFLGTFVYVGLSLLFGQNSVNCYNQLSEQKKLISKQTSEIENINSELQLELTALENDKAVIAAYARRLDYVSNDEKIVKINGLKPLQTTLYDTGSVLHHEEVPFVPEMVCKLLGLFSFLFSLLTIFLIDLVKGNISFKKEKTIVTGIPVYDLPQI